MLDKLNGDRSWSTLGVCQKALVNAEEKDLYNAFRIGLQWVRLDAKPSNSQSL